MKLEKFCLPFCNHDFIEAARSSGNRETRRDPDAHPQPSRLNRYAPLMHDLAV